VKAALVADAGFFAWLELNGTRVIAREPAALGEAIRRACEIKAAIVAADEREEGRRALLNLGHTFGHAIEAGAGYGNLLHGEAVATGLALAAELSARTGRIPAGDATRVRALLSAAGLPADPPRIGRARMLELMSMDKKVKGGQVRLVLLDAIGRATVTADYPREALEALVEERAGP
jgi:3-dehydroquinate synthase